MYYHILAIFHTKMLSKLINTLIKKEILNFNRRVF